MTPSLMPISAWKISAAVPTTALRMTMSNSAMIAPFPRNRVCPAPSHSRAADRAPDGLPGYWVKLRARSTQPSPRAAPSARTATPEGACNARRTCMYVERCRRPRTKYGEANWPSTALGDVGNAYVTIRLHMGRKTSRYGFLPLLVAAVALIGVVPGEAVSFVLADRDREQAIRAGKKSIVLEEFGAEWRLRDASGQALVVMTPFHRLALAARNSAFRGEEIKPRDIESVLKDHTGVLSFWATLRGNKVDFARFYTPTLMAGSLAVKASFVQNERTALRA